MPAIKTLTSILFFLATLSLFGQGRTTLEVYGGYGISESPNDFLERIGAETDEVLVARIGISVSVPVLRNFFVRTGGQFANYGFSFPAEATSGNRATSSFTVGNRDKVVEIPLLIRYELPVGQRLRPFLEGGVAANIYLHTRNQFKATPMVIGWSPEDLAEAERPQQIPGRRKFSTVARISLGANWYFAKRISLFVAAVHQRHLNSTAEEGLANVRPWLLDAEVGMRYALSR